MLATEFGGMNEMMADLYADTGDKRWLDLSYRFEHDAVLGPLKRGEDPLNGLHGNTQVPKLVGSAARYANTGDRAISRPPLPSGIGSSITTPSRPGATEKTNTFASRIVSPPLPKDARQKPATSTTC